MSCPRCEMLQSKGFFSITGWSYRICTGWEEGQTPQMSPALSAKDPEQQSGKSNALQRPQASGRQQTDLWCYLSHWIVIVRWKQGTLPGWLWSVLVSEFTANEHNNFHTWKCWRLGWDLDVNKAGSWVALAQLGPSAEGLHRSSVKEATCLSVQVWVTQVCVHTCASSEKALGNAFINKGAHCYPKPKYPFYHYWTASLYLG